jgi:hypothetical protein
MYDARVQLCVRMYVRVHTQIVPHVSTCVLPWDLTCDSVPSLARQRMWHTRAKYSLAWRAVFFYNGKLFPRTGMSTLAAETLPVIASSPASRRWTTPSTRSPSHRGWLPL